MPHLKSFAPIVAVAALAVAGTIACGAPTPPPSSAQPGAEAGPGVDADARRWVDSVLAGLDTRERAAQLVVPWMWGRYVSEGDDEWARLRGWVADNGVGGIITSIGPPVALADKLNRLQRLADVPLLIMADLEHGPGMRLAGGTLLPYGVDMGGGTDFPPAMAVGATGDPSHAYAMGRVTAAEGRAVGIHMTLAPVVDVNNNPANPIINVRSYGGDPAAVAELGAAQVRGLQEHGMLATAKHFPGHGDVENDTHVAPLILRISAARADSVELVPYHAVIDAGVAAVMPAHIVFPALTGDSVLPATLSPRLLDSLLVRELGFDGLIVTDALDMGAIVQAFGPGEAAVLALHAGADILLQPVDPGVMIDAVVGAVGAGRITAERLERSVRKVLEAKARVGLHRARTVDVGRVAATVGAAEHRALAATVAERSMTLARDRERLVPLVPLRDRRVLLISYTDQLDPFAGRTLARTLAPALPEIERVRLGPQPPASETLDSIQARADTADLVILAVSARVTADRPAIDSATVRAFRGIAGRRPAILVSLRSPYLIQELPEVGTYLLAWGRADVSQAAAGRALLGQAPITGRLPIEIPPLHQAGDGLHRPALVDAVTRIGIGSGPGTGREAPAGRGEPLDPASLRELEDAVQAAIDAGTTPGAVVAVGTSRGQAWVRAFGRTDWAAGAPAATDSTLYDLASLTKVVATTTAIMLLVDQGRMRLDAPLSEYLPRWPEDGWRDEVTIGRLLAHTAGVSSFVPFWHPARGALRGRESILDAIVRLQPEPPPAPGSRHVYSDLGLILLGAAVEATTGMSLDAFLRNALWRPLGMRHTTFNPVEHGFPLARIAPTERDTILRHTHVHGVVHDENAWAMGGVAGHAGLFSTAPDLARYARMMLRAGAVPGGERVLRPATVARFTTPQPGRDRALGWDAAPGTRIAEPLSSAAFGHTGFTGTSLWVDPDRDLYVVLLTNRVNPTRERGGIGELRRAVHEAAARAVEGARR